MGLALTPWPNNFLGEIGNVHSLMYRFLTLCAKSLQHSPKPLLSEAGDGEEEGLWRANQGSETWHILAPSVHNSRRNRTNRNSRLQEARVLYCWEAWQAYEKTLHIIRCRLNFSLLRSTIMCLRGSQSTTHRPASPLAGDIIDLSTARGRVPNDDRTISWLLCTFYYYSLFPFLNSGSAHVCLCCKKAHTVCA